VLGGRITVKHFIGIDPDLHSLFTAVIQSEEDGRNPVLLRVHTTKCKGLRDEAAVTAILNQYKSNHTESRASFGFGACDMVDSVTVESQRILHNAARPQDLLHLAQVAGGLVSYWSLNGRQYESPNFVAGKSGVAIISDIQLVQPQEWKGSVPKHIKQARVFSALGIPYDLAGGRTQYAVPKYWQQYDADNNMNAGDWMDAADSVGLALYGYLKYFGKKQLTT
jgi:hypothetical protein